MVTVTRMFPRDLEEGTYLENVAIFAARRCRTTKRYYELWREVNGYTTEKRENFITQVVYQDFAIDVLEMLHLVFDIEDVPLWLVIEMLRHRLLFRDFSMEQLSQRAIDPLRLRVVAPTPELQALVDDYLKLIHKAIEEGRVPPENLREIMPQGVLVNLVLAGNARAWHHLFYMRCSTVFGGKGGAHIKFMALADAAFYQAHQVYPLGFKEIIPA